MKTFFSSYILIIMIKMLGTLGSKLHKAISNFISGGVADKEAIKQLKNEMLRALLESDVDFEIANKVVSEVEKKSLEKELPDGLSRKKVLLVLFMTS